MLLWYANILKISLWQVHVNHCCLHPHFVDDPNKIPKCLMVFDGFYCNIIFPRVDSQLVIELSYPITPFSRILCWLNHVWSQLLMVTFLFERLLPDVGKHPPWHWIMCTGCLTFFHIFLKVCLPFGQSHYYYWPSFYTILVNHSYYHEPLLLISAIYLTLLLIFSMIIDTLNYCNY